MTHFDQMATYEAQNMATNYSVNVQEHLVPMFKKLLNVLFVKRRPRHATKRQGYAKMTQVMKAVLLNDWTRVPIGLNDVRLCALLFRRNLGLDAMVVANDSVYYDVKANTLKVVIFSLIPPSPLVSRRLPRALSCLCQLWRSEL